MAGVATTLALIYVLDAAVQKRADDRARNETLRIAGTLRAQIEQDLTATILLQKGLAAYYAINPDMTNAEFDAFASDLMAGARHVRNLGFSRGTVIAGVYPLAGNEPAVGVDYRSLPEQWPAIEQAISLRSSVLPGPVPLVQGGLALIGRTPVFHSPPGGPPGSGEFMGLVSVVISIDSLLSQLDMAEIERTQRVALRGTDGEGAGGAVFYGQLDQFYAPKAVNLDVSLPGGYWQLSVLPRFGEGLLSPELTAVRWFGIAAAGLAGVVTFLVVRYVEQGRRARRHAAESEARFRDFAESSADWFWETDAEHRFTWFSTRSTIPAEVATAPMIGRTRFELANADMSRPHWRRHANDLDAHCAFRDFEYDAETRRGRRYFRVSGLPVFDRMGAFLGHRGSAADVTDQQQSRIKLAEALRQAEMANAAKSSFLAQMSHELRTPLNAIIGFAEIISGQLLGPQVGERYRSYAADILASGRHLLALVNDLLDIGRIESGNLQIQVKDVDVAALAAEAIGMVSTAAAKAGLTVECGIPEALPKLEADPRAVMQILVNLLTNAVKFTSPGGRIRVTASVDESDAMVLSVADTGIGIEAGDLVRVLRPFEHADGAMVRSRVGTGLGLPISAGLMRLHGGVLTIESRPGEGTTVSCRFPPARVMGQRPRLVAT